jgi:succinate dehydrogenase / fumarate reductase flavoprotein subunit
MQGLADGYFIIPYTIGNYLASGKLGKVDGAGQDFKRAEHEADERNKKLMGNKGKRTATSFHRELGKLLWDNCGMARNAAGLRSAVERIPQLREEFWSQVVVPGSGSELNQALEYAGRVADFMEFGELICRDALERNESCGCHFREEFHTEEGEAKRNDADFAHVAVWEYRGEGNEPVRHKENLTFENAHLAQRSYK